MLAIYYDYYILNFNECTQANLHTWSGIIKKKLNYLHCYVQQLSYIGIGII